jgi:tetratricopeptide (TPR) repeat protein
LAKEGRWEEAVQVNRELLAIFPDDSETLNRLGKAYLELKKFGEAKAAYEHAVKVDRSNSIAQKNLQRLGQYTAVSSAISPLDDSEAGGVIAVPVASAAREKVQPSVFIEETGKTGTTSLINVAPVVVLAKLTAGDTVTLEIDSKGQNLLVKNTDNEVIGHIEPKMALRLIKFMEAGNRYAANVTGLGEQEVKIIIREIYQHPSMRGKLSFPPRTGGTGYRAYTRDTVLRGFGIDDDEEAPDYTDNDDDDDETESLEEEADVSDDYNDDSDDNDL